MGLIKFKRPRTNDSKQTRGADLPSKATNLSELTLNIMAVIRAIPRGRVATYKQVAELAGRKHASRAVVWVLSSCSRKYRLPWHRVISAQGKIAFAEKSSHFYRQRRLLAAEGVQVDGQNGRVDLSAFQYRKKPKSTRPRNAPTLFD